MVPLSPAARSALARVADRTTDWRFHCWYWGDAIAIDGLLEAHAVAGGAYRDVVAETLNRWHFHCLPNFDDVLAPGAAIIRLVIDGDLPVGAAARLLNQLDGLPSVFGAIPALEPQRLFFRNGLCIDAVYHLPATYAMAARWRSDKSLAARAVRIAIDSMRLLQCTTGWAQWYDPTHRKNNAIAWSRGLGWALLGLLDLLTLLDGDGGDEVADLAAAVMARLAATQAADGNWAEVLDHPHAGFETSTAAFFVASVLHPAARTLAAVPPDVLQRAITACERALADDGTFTGVTADVLPSWDIKTYENCPTEPSPWAQGAGLRAFAALARREANQT
jgi:hypothetical protein